MTDLTYAQLFSEFLSLYQAGEYTQALELVNRHAEAYPGREAKLANWRMCMHALLGQKEQALQTFRRAVENGVWWTEESLRKDPDLAALQGDPGFESLVELCAARDASARKSARPELTVRMPPQESREPYPLLLVFHGRGQNGLTFAPYWESLPPQGWLVGIAQSSQILGYNEFGWDDWERALDEAARHFQTLCEEFPIDPGRVVLGGFSQGAGMSLELALTGRIPVRGTIGVAPYHPNPDALDAQLRDNPAWGAREYLVTGGKDPIGEVIERIEDLLRMHGAPYQCERHPDLAHEFPPDFEGTLQKAVGYILIEPQDSKRKS